MGGKLALGLRGGMQAKVSSLLLEAPSGQDEDFRVEKMGQLCPLQAEVRCPGRVGGGQRGR